MHPETYVNISKSQTTSLEQKSLNKYLQNITRFQSLIKSLPSKHRKRKDTTEITKKMLGGQRLRTQSLP